MKLSTVSLIEIRTVPGGTIKTDFFSQDNFVLTLKTCPDNPIEGHAEQEEPMVGKMTIREDLDALMENLDKMTLQLEKLNKNVELVQTRVSH